MTAVGGTQKPFILARWPARPEALPEIAAKLLQTLAIVAGEVNSEGMEWAYDAGGEAHLRLRPFPTEADPSDLGLESFFHKDESKQIWTKGGLTVLLYGRVSEWPTGKMVSLTGTVGADTRIGNSLQIAFLSQDSDFLPSSSWLSSLVEKIGELWNATWCAALNDEIIDGIDLPFGEPEIGIISYWADNVNRSLPEADGVSIRKTAKGQLAQVRDLDSESAISYARKVYGLQRLEPNS
jgi:hypothetical protein